MTVPEQNHEQQSHDPIKDTAYSWYVLAMLMLAYALSYIDRQMLSLLVGPVKSHFSLSDTQFSLVQGTAFVVGYMIASPIFGRMVDHGNRRNILIAGLLAWSGFTAYGGLAETYTQLFISRLGIGFAEACVFPVGLSLIGDYFSAQKMPRAMSTFTLSNQLGSGFSLIFGGLVIAFAASLTQTIPFLGTLQTWQMVLVVISCPGALFAIALLSIREPRNTHAASATSSAMSFREVREVFSQQRGFYLCIYGAISALSAINLGQAAWYPAFLMRVHHLDAATTGFQFGASALIIGVSANILGPFASSWMQRRGHIDAPLRVASFAAIGMFVGCVTIPIWSSALGAFVSTWVIFFSCAFPIGLIAGATQNATPPRMRGIVAAIYTFVAQLFGYMLSPAIIALLTDRYFKDENMVGYSMQIVMSASALIVGVLLLRSCTHYRRIIAGQAQTG